MRPLRLAFIAPGNSIHTRRWLEFFAGRGHSVGLVSYGPLREPPRGAEVLLELTALGQGRGAAARLASLPSALVGTRRALARFGPDLLHAHYLTGPGWLGLATGMRPLVLSGWGSDVLLDPRRPLVRALHRATVHAAAAATCDARPVADGLIRLGLDPEWVRVILWGVDLERFTPVGPAERARYELPDDAFVVLAVRGVRDVQNPVTIVDAFATVARARPEAVLGLMLGPHTSELPAPVADAIRRHGLGDRVRIIGPREHEQLAGLYLAADVCVSVPSSDGTSIAVLEAMACGKPSVVSDVPANRWLVEDGVTGLVVPPRDAEGLAAALDRLAGSVELRRRIGSAAHEWATREADVRRTLVEAEKLYAEVLGER